MPLFEYRCTKCGLVYQLWKNVPPTPEGAKCRVCGGPGVQVLGAAKLNFKGSGWYKTDYANKEIGLPSDDD
jgi:putative FmdB family regulatory protein